MGEVSGSGQELQGDDRTGMKLVPPIRPGNGASSGDCGTAQETMIFEAGAMQFGSEIAAPDELRSPAATEQAGVQTVMPATQFGEFL